MTPSGKSTLWEPLAPFQRALDHKQRASSMRISAKFSTPATSISAVAKAEPHRIVRHCVTRRPLPCWTDAQLDDFFAPGAFNSMGGTACALFSLGYLEAINSARGCTIHKDLASVGFRGLDPASTLLRISVS